MSLTDDLPDRGHNLPPGIDLLPALPPEPASDAVEAVLAQAETPAESLPYDAAKHAAFKLRVTAFADACGKWRDLKKIDTAEQSGKLTDFVTGAQGIEKLIEQQRKTEKKVWDDKGKAVQTAYTDLLDVMKRAIDSVKPLQADWLKREEDRIAREKAEEKRIADEKAAEADRLAQQAAARNDVMGEAEAERLRKEAEKGQRAAARPVKAKAGSASGGGRAMSLRTVRSAEIHNQNGVYMCFREDQRVVALLQQLANEAVRSGVEFDPKILTVKIDRVAA